MTKGTPRFRKKYFALGISKNIDEDLRKHLYIFNKFILFIQLVILLLAVYNLLNFHFYRFATGISIFGLTFTFPILHYKKFYKLPRIIMATVPILLIMSNRFFETNHELVDFPVLSYMVLICMFPSLIFFSIKTEFQLIAKCLLFNLIMLISSNAYLLWIDGKLNSVFHHPMTPIKLMEMILWLTIVISFIFYKRIVNRFEEKTSAINQNLIDSKKEILELNKKLSQKIDLRSQQLELQNKQLFEYAYINSHILRSPLCNIIALVDLLEKEEDEKVKTQLISYLKKSSTDLDNATKQINEIVKPITP